MKVNILGTEYTIEVRKISEDKTMRERSLAGWCSEDSRLIVIADMDEEKYFNWESEEAKDVYAKKRWHMKYYMHSSTKAD